MINRIVFGTFCSIERGVGGGGGWGEEGEEGR